MVKTQTAHQWAADTASAPIILTTKLYIPSTRPHLVSRPHLVARLNNALRMGHKLILLSASPGFGKTTLLSEWIHQKAEKKELQPSAFSLQPSRVAWLSLDEDDNNPHRFLAYCVVALQNVQPGVGHRAMALFQSSDLHMLTPEMFVTALINEAAPITTPFIFVLDDYHVIQNSFIHNSLAFFLENMPPQVQLVIAGRTAPPLPLARLRGRGQLTELTTADLRFTPAEVALFLNQAMGGCNLSAAEVSALESRTEGWVAGLQMAALSMQGLTDTAGFVKVFAGSHRYILDYLLEEVLNRQPEPIQRFLLQSSVLNRLCGPLCDAVLGLGDSMETTQTPFAHSPFVDSYSSAQEILEDLDQSNLFIVSLDDERCWYRYHRLFADLLRHRLNQLASLLSIEVAVLHRRASVWYEQNGFPVEAMSHALAAVDVERVVRLARQKAATRLSRSELVTLLSWLDALPRAMDRSHPRLSLLHAWAMLLTGELQAVETHLDEAERGFKATNDSSGAKHGDILGEVATLRGGVAYLQRDMPQARALYCQALEHLAPDNLFMRGIVMQCLGAAYSWCGNIVEAAQAFDEVRVISHSSGNILVDLIAMGNLAQFRQEQGYLRQASGVYRQGFDFFDRESEANKKPLRPFVRRI